MITMRWHIEWLYVIQIYWDFPCIVFNLFGKLHWTERRKWNIQTRTHCLLRGSCGKCNITRGIFFLFSIENLTFFQLNIVFYGRGGVIDVTLSAGSFVLLLIIFYCLNMKLWSATTDTHLSSIKFVAVAFVCRRHFLEVLVTSQGQNWE